MKLLAIDTSTLVGGVAIMEDNLLIAESRFNVKATHSERLLFEIHDVLKKINLSINEIDVFTLAIGPGSFTGLRIGLSTIKGFLYGTEKKFVTVPTLEALAWNLPFCKYQICTLLDARKKEVFAALFRWEGDLLKRELKEQALRIDELLEKINETTIFIGDGALLYKEVIKLKLANTAFFAPPQFMIPSPSNVAYLGMQKVQKGQLDDILKTVPLYLRKSEAELKKP
ncbi:MAG: tRNA (adenosine(37)-N6)-threonylcarbamoyltransferase complex dimerization subunit type 1 TsaB [Thermodesulfovibrionales bacterium]|nr:tRNA (adenosine(37)-N6)-threonylcarbamoyltransferase complex dimerization subunit type 1 TsaB [Thermodesulfovibrionales bacterium]